MASKELSEAVVSDETPLEEEKKKESWFNTWPAILLICVVLPLAFRSLFFAPFHIPSGSMKSTMLVGDYLFVSKYAYGYSKYSFPFGVELLNTRSESDEPKRGEVVVFRPPLTPNTDFIKRVVGLPGDKVQMKGSELYLNGKRVPRVRNGEFVDVDEETGEERTLARYTETLPNGVSYAVLDDTPIGRWDNTPEYTVPANHYFMMGDNRDHSSDSRTRRVGFVPRENLVGRAEIILLSSEAPLWKVWTWFSSFRGDRYWKSIQGEQAQ